MVAKLLKSDFLYEIIKKLLASGAEIENTFHIPLVNIKKLKLMYLNIGKVPKEDTETYVRASVAVPVFNSGVLINDEIFLRRREE